MNQRQKPESMVCKTIKVTYLDKKKVRKIRDEKKKKKLFFVVRKLLDLDIAYGTCHPRCER